MKIVLVTNDYPPRVGGIQVYLENIYRRLAARHQITVVAPPHPRAAAWDRLQPYEIVRHGPRVYWPRASLQRRVADLARDADAVAFGAVVPMNWMAPKLGRPIVVHTHGFEVALGRLPALRSALRRICGTARLVTVVSEYTRRFIEPVVGAGPRIEMLKTGVDLEIFNPGVDGAEVRKRHGLGGRPVLACVSRLVPRKGQDTIIQAMPAIARRVPDAAALIVGDGPHRVALEKLAGRLRVSDRVVFAGETPFADLAAHYAAGDIFAMPCRSRYANLEVEGLGLVYLEAQACGRPAIAGDSGGAPEAVLENETGLVVPGGDPAALADAAASLLADPARAAAMGKKGRAFVEANHHWDRVAARYEALLGDAI
ncbi:MAG TPA: glycosyltransferase family 4 protein [Actinomycetota bacterium]